MSVAAVVLVKDEADIIEHTIRWLDTQVDAIIVADNLSTDETPEILHDLRMELELGSRLHVRTDEQIGYYQAEKTTALAALALELGHQWVMPCDADEFWYATDGRRISDFLAGMAPDVAVLAAPMFHHLPAAGDPPASCSLCLNTGWDPNPPPEAAALSDPLACPACKGEVEPNPFVRIGWRQREHGTLPKVACRTRPGLEIGQGNHSAWAPGGGLTVKAGLVVRHFSWRTEDQYVRKILNGAAAYAATDLPANAGEHWKAFGIPPDETAARSWFQTWAWQDDPGADDTLIYDPAPWRGKEEDR